MIRPARTLSGTLLPTVCLSEPGVLYCRWDCPLPQTATTQVNLCHYLPLPLGQPLAALLVDPVVGYVLASIQRFILSSEGQCPLLRCLHPYAPMELDAASVAKYRVEVFSVPPTLPCSGGTSPDL
jgi:hypothetical protein